MNTGDVSLWSVSGIAALWFLREIAGFVLKVKFKKYKAGVSRFFNSKLFFVLWDLLAMSTLVWLAFVMFNSDIPATKKDLLIGMSLALGFGIMFANFFDDLVIWARRYQEIKIEDTLLLAPLAVPNQKNLSARQRNHQRKISK